MYTLNTFDLCWEKAVQVTCLFAYVRISVPQVFHFAGKLKSLLPYVAKRRCTYMLYHLSILQSISRWYHTLNDSRNVWYKTLQNTVPSFVCTFQFPAFLGSLHPHLSFENISYQTWTQTYYHPHLVTYFWVPSMHPMASETHHCLIYIQCNLFTVSWLKWHTVLCDGSAEDSRFYAWM